jgi:hypothetical protein
VREPGQSDQEEDDEREHVEDALDDDGRRELGSRVPGAPMERHDPGRLARAGRKHIVEEVADEERAHRRWKRRARLGREEVTPPNRPQEDGGREHGERG